VGALSTIVALSLLAARGDAGAPSFVAQPNRVAAITLPASILADRDVQQQIASGLTTTFVLIAHQRGSDSQGGAKLEIRFDLWDEVWLVHRVEFDGKESHERIASQQSLEKWWTAPLRLIAAGAQRASLTVVMSVLPFSGAEENDARDWVAKSARAGPAEPRSSPFVAALIGTTLSAKPIRTYRWSGDVSFP
jgi:hypothetical protein